MKKMLLCMVLLSFQALAGEYLVKYKNSGAISSLNYFSDKSRMMTVMESLPKAKLIKVNIDERHLDRSLAEIYANPGVEYVVPNFKLHSFTSVPFNAAAMKDQWANAKVQAEKAWKRAGNKGSKKVIVAVIDTGVDYKHQNLASNMIPGYDFKGKDSDPMDETGGQNPGHGTHCAGSVAGNGLVDGGIIGLSPEVSVMPLRFLGADGSGNLDDGIKAIDYAIEKGAHVISASWGAAVSRAQAAPLVEAVKRADDKGVIFVMAAANDGKNNDSYEVYPANSGFSNTITVAASGSSDAKPSWSNYGKAKVHLASPGEGIMSTLPGNKWGNLSGTSMATPLVSGLVALLKAQDMSLTGAQIRAILQTTGAKVAIETACNCRVDAYEAVDAVLSKKITLVPSAATLAPGETMNFSAVYGQAPFKFVSSNASTATISENGQLSAVADGVTTITVTDANGKTATSLDINVTKGGGGDDGGDGGDGGGGFECPFDPQICQIICQIQPDLPFCQ